MGQRFEATIRGKIYREYPDSYHLHVEGHQGERYFIRLPKHQVRIDHVNHAPGSVIRHRLTGNKYLVGAGGYYDFQTDRWCTSGHVFTTEYHDLLELPE